MPSIYSNVMVMWFLHAEFCSGVCSKFRRRLTFGHSNGRIFGSHRPSVFLGSPFPLVILSSLWIDNLSYNVAESSVGFQKYLPCPSLPCLPERRVRFQNPQETFIPTGHSQPYRLLYRPSSFVSSSVCLSVERQIDCLSSFFWEALKTGAGCCRMLLLSSALILPCVIMLRGWMEIYLAFVLTFVFLSRSFSRLISSSLSFFWMAAIALWLQSIPPLT